MIRIVMIRHGGATLGADCAPRNSFIVYCLHICFGINHTEQKGFVVSAEKPAVGEATSKLPPPSSGPMPAQIFTREFMRLELDTEHPFSYPPLA
jgi:hypothetical protein